MSHHPLHRGRLAPSPTGGLHLGHARTFLAAWLSARSKGGQVVLRIEDLDSTRVRDGAARGMIDDLQWLGLNWDEGTDLGGPSAPYLQSERTRFHEDASRHLIAQERIYPCTCTRAEIARAGSAPHAEDEGPTYPGTCSGRSASEAKSLKDRPFAWRFRTPSAPISWDDVFLGRVELNPAQVGGDFLVGRNHRAPAYQLAVVVDDAGMGVTEVIRGEDLVPSTPRQILLYHALGKAIPTFGHIPLVIDTDGTRLAKRNQAIKLSTLRQNGLDPRRLVGLLAVSLGMAEEIEPSEPGRWVDRFDPARVPSTPFRVGSEIPEQIPTRRLLFPR